MVSMLCISLWNFSKRDPRLSSLMSNALYRTSAIGDSFFPYAKYIWSICFSFSVWPSSFPLNELQRTKEKSTCSIFFVETKLNHIPISMNNKQHKYLVYLYSWALEKQISRKLLHLRMYAITEPKIFPVNNLSCINFFSNTNIMNSLIFLQLKQNFVAFRTPSLPSFPLIANILSTSTIFFALSIISSHMTWKNCACVLWKRYIYLLFYTKQYKEIYKNGAEFQKMSIILPVIGKGHVFKYDMHIRNGGF